MTEVMVKSGLECFACGISIGPGYMESIPSMAGDKTFCGLCCSRLKKQGYIQINMFQRLLSDGRVIKFLQKANEELEEK